jgi:hypothetical protein
MATVTPTDIALPAQMAGLRFPEEDLPALAEALAAHLAFVGPLLDADLDDTAAVLTYDPRWPD